MAVPKMRELRDMTAEELTGKYRELSEELAKERGHIASGTRPDNPGKIRAIRRTIARIKTIETIKQAKTTETAKQAKPIETKEKERKKTREVSAKNE